MQTPRKSPTSPPGEIRRSTMAVETDANRKQMVEMARANIEHVLAGNTPSREADVLRVPAENYLDPLRWQREVDMFRRMPLVLALGGELRGPSSYKAMTVMDVPVLMTRGTNGEVRAFVNQCSHRGAVVVADGIGTARRFACPYHNWTYDTKGDLVGVTDREFFGDIDTSCLGLTPLTVAERAGLIFVVITPGVPMNIDEHLCRYDRVLDFFGFGDWHLISQRELPGPNWKVAYDGYLDFYHLPFLHRNSFGTEISNKAIYHAWGPHQRVTSPDPGLVFVVLTPGVPMDIDEHLCGYDTVLDFFGFGDWHLISTREIAGPNWKIAYDGYLDFYHLPFLHRNSFGPDISNKSIYFNWGPHQRMTSPDPTLLQLQDLPEDEWNMDLICGGVWTIFPHVSFAGGNGGGLISQLFPGPTPGSSITIQNYYTAAEPSPEGRVAAQEKADFLERVVREEDYFTGLRLQRALATRSREHVVFGRNEGGGQRFHQLLDQFVGTVPT